jgi:hypothetical protein
VTALKRVVELGLAEVFLPNDARKLKMVDAVEWDRLSECWFKVSAAGKALVIEMQESPDVGGVV